MEDGANKEGNWQLTIENVSYVSVQAYTTFKTCIHIVKLQKAL